MIAAYRGLAARPYASCERRMAALARTLVLLDATLVGALSAQICRSLTELRTRQFDPLLPYKMGPDERAESARKRSSAAGRDHPVTECTENGYRRSASIYGYRFRIAPRRSNVRPAPNAIR
jgi:hypothetical protein